jgi:ribosomal protein S21
MAGKYVQRRARNTQKNPSTPRKQQNKIASRRYSRHALDSFVVPEEVFTVAFM